MNWITLKKKNNNNRICKSILSLDSLPLLPHKCLVLLGALPLVVNPIKNRILH